MIPVAANDVAFSIHAVLLTAITLFQIAIYEVSASLSFSGSFFNAFVINLLILVVGFMQRGVQKVSKLSIAIVFAVWLSAAVCFFVALPHHSWLWLIGVFK